MPILVVSDLNPTPGEHANHYSTGAVYIPLMSVVNSQLKISLKDYHVQECPLLSKKQFFLGLHNSIILKLCFCKNGFKTEISTIQQSTVSWLKPLPTLPQHLSSPEILLDSCCSMFSVLWISIWPLYCLFFDLQLLPTPLVSSNFSFRC